MTRPWITPCDVKEYTSIEDVVERTDAKLRIDIIRAEQAVIFYTNNQFEDMEKLPDSVRTALILLAEHYAQRAVKGNKEYKSESFDDYSYTVSDSNADIRILDLAPLLDDYVIQKSKNQTIFRMRKL